MAYRRGKIKDVGGTAWRKYRNPGETFVDWILEKSWTLPHFLVVSEMFQCHLKSYLFISGNVLIEYLFKHVSEAPDGGIDQIKKANQVMTKFQWLEKPGVSVHLREYRY